MKKLFVIAAAAVAALAACTKTEVKSPDQAITFEVANYTVATKAPTSLITEGFNQFTTYAWYTPATGTANQAFMNPATVEYDATNQLWHATDRTYFWPKTGFINFFSFAGDHLPDAVALDSADSDKAKAHYTTTITVATDDNILIADGAYGYSSNPNATYGHDGVTKGVPTLFRHMLSRVKFDIKVDATEVTDNKNNWSIVVNSATVSYCNKGTLEVAFPAAPAVTFDADGKPVEAPSTAKYASAVWTPGTTDATLSKVSGTVTTNANGGSVSDVVELIADSVVMPQTLATTGATIALEYTITHTYNGANPVVETVPISAKALTTFATSVAAWAPNTIYTYHIIVKPNGEILFDPAVEEWAQESTEPSFTIL